MLPLVSGINSRLPSVNHAIISQILLHPVLWVALPPSVPSTHHFHHISPLHSFTPGLKQLPFLQILPTVAYLIFFRTDFTDSPDCLPIFFNLAYSFSCSPLFTTRCYASAVLALSVCLSVCVCLSQVGVLLKWLNVGSHKQHHTIAQGL